jgi:triacylglycerol esterase/lipase EstA (alpha/beta hydrolase family)
MEGGIMDCTILVHGFLQTKSDMRFLSDGLQSAGFNTMVASLPTTICSVKTCATLLNADISEKIREYGKVNFVGHSMGGLIIRKYIQEYNPDNIGRCIFIATPHLGSEIADAASNIPFVNALMKSLEDLKSSKTNKYLLNKERIEIGLIVGKHNNIIGELFLTGSGDCMVEITSALSEDAKEIRQLEYTHYRIHHSTKAVELVKTFILTGSFNGADKK